MGKDCLTYTLGAWYNAWCWEKNAPHFSVGLNTVTFLEVFQQLLFLENECGLLLTLRIPLRPFLLLYQLTTQLQYGGLCSRTGPLLPSPSWKDLLPSSKDFSLFLVTAFSVVCASGIH